MTRFRASKRGRSCSDHESDGERRRGMTSLRLVLDLDQTLIHALDQSECPANAKEIADCVVPVCHNGLEFNVAVRRGATRLVQQWKARRDVDLCIGTSNLLAREILTAVSSAQPAWNDIPLHIFASRERGGLARHRRAWRSTSRQFERVGQFERIANPVPRPGRTNFVVHMHV